MLSLSLSHTYTHTHTHTRTLTHPHSLVHPRTGSDDFWGEDDHMSHHYNTGVYHRDLPALQKSKEPLFRAAHASVFRRVSIMELSIFVLFGLYDQLADVYVDHSGELTREQVKDMFRQRVTRKETTYEQYSAFLSHPTKEARQQLKLLSSATATATKAEAEAEAEAEDMCRAAAGGDALRECGGDGDGRESS